VTILRRKPKYRYREEAIMANTDLIINAWVRQDDPITFKSKYLSFAIMTTRLFMGGNKKPKVKTTTAAIQFFHHSLQINFTVEYRGRN
jgi:hypothetical protein